MGRSSTKNWIRVVIVLSAIFLIVGSQVVGSVHASTLIVQRRFNGSLLRVSGTSIVDNAGKAILLRGVNFFGYEFGLWDRHQESDYQRIASWGFNAVRLPIAWNFIEPQPGSYDDSYFTQYVDRDISWAAKYGIYIILDMHQYCWSPYFTFCDSWHTAGVPSWAVSGYANTAEGQAHARADFWSNLGPNGAAPSATNPSMQDRFAAMWQHVASRYAGQNMIAAYDLLNEPTAFSSNGKFIFYDVDKFSSEALPAFYAKVADAIRTVDDNHILLWEPDWGTHVSPTTAVRRPNMIYAPHYPGTFSVDSYDGNKSTLSSAVQAILQFATESNQPVLFGEWGICAEGTNAIQYVSDLGDIMHAYNIGWTWWTYGRTSFGMSLIDETGSVRTILVNGLLSVLAL